MVKLAFTLLLIGSMASCSSSKDVVMNDEVASPPPASASSQSAAPVTVAANEAARQPNAPEPANLGAASAGRGR